MPVGSGDLPVELADGVFWLGDCVRYAVGIVPVHTYHNVYAVAGAGETLVYDTGHPKDWPVVARQIDELHAAGLPPVRYVFPSHCEAPHGSNLGRWLERYPDAVGCGDVRDYHLVFPQLEGRLVQLEPGDVLDVGGRPVDVLHGIFNDSVTTRWAYDERAGVLFTGDGFSYPHFHGEDYCGHPAEEMPVLPLPQLTAVFTDAAFRWTKFADIEPLIAELEDLFATRRIEIVAPAHGAPIRDPETTVPEAIEGLRLGQSIGKQEVGEFLLALPGAPEPEAVEALPPAYPGFRPA